MNFILNYIGSIFFFLLSLSNIILIYIDVVYKGQVSYITIVDFILIIIFGTLSLVFLVNGISQQIKNNNEL